MQTTRSEVYSAIDGERRYQQAKWNPLTTETSGVHSNAEFLIYIRDYVEEALHGESRLPEQACGALTKHTLRKIAALAVAAMEQNGVLSRETEGARPIGV